MSHFNVCLYFYLRAIAVFLLALSITFLASLAFEHIFEALPFAAGLTLITGLWSAWRIQIQRKYDLEMTRSAFRIYLPLCLLSYPGIGFGLIVLASQNAVFRSEFKFAIVACVAVACLPILMQLIDYNGMPRKSSPPYPQKKPQGKLPESTIHRKFAG